MDKYEFNIKVEQIKKMVSKNDFETAMKIADTIDWRRVRSVNILSMVANIYEKNHEYQEAKDILLLAFERAPMGKRLLYKLAELAIKEGSIDESEDYYREFCELAPEDPRQYILRYLILGAKGAPVAQLIHTLEQYCNAELDEKWLYELAELYNEAGMGDLCVMTCDKLSLMFGLGKYVDKAMDLKLQYAPLTKTQVDLVENRDKYEARLKAVEQEYSAARPMVQPVYQEEPAPLEPQTEDLLADPAEEEYTRQDREFRGTGRFRTLEKSSFEARREAAAAREPDAYSIQDPADEYPAETAEYGSDYPEEAAAAYEDGYIEEAAAYGDGYAEEASAYRDDYAENETASYSDGYPEEAAAYGESHAEEADYSDSYSEEAAAPYSDGYTEEGASDYSSSYPEEAAAVYGDGCPEEGTFDYEDSYPEDETDAYSDGYPEDEADAYSNGCAEDENVSYEEPQVSGRSMEDTAVRARIHEAEAQASLAMEMSRLSEDNDLPPYTEQEMAQTRVLTDIRQLTKGVMYSGSNHLMIEAEVAEEGLELAVEALRKIHQETGARNQAAKITGEKLNRRGIFTISDKLTGKDLIIEQAGDMNESILQELNQLMARDETGMNVVLIDTAERLEELHRIYPGLAKRFECIGTSGQPQEAPVYAQPDSRQIRQVQVEPSRPAPVRQAARPVKGPQPRPSARPLEETAPAHTGRRPVPACTDTNTASDRPVRTCTDADPSSARPAAAYQGTVPTPARSNPAHTAPAPVKEPEYEPEEAPVEDEIMDIDEFARYASEYASKIDCSITGKSMLALYERVEIMEEDGVPLTKANAEAMIEEAADKAENPTFGRRLTGIFSSKYNKEGLLVLKEEHFI